MNMKMNARTKLFGLQMLGMVDHLPNKASAWIIAKQLIRSATSVGANYRAAFRAKSNADFIYKLKIVEEEADETIYWLEMIEESKMLSAESVRPLKLEAHEILSIVIASIRTARAKEMK